jgi:hypothetical protein
MSPEPISGGQRVNAYCAKRKLIRRFSVVFAVLAALFLVYNRRERAYEPATHEKQSVPTAHERDWELLVDQLATTELVGISVGGPYVGIGDNAITTKIVAQGPPIIPYLVARLDNSNLNQTIYILFCLRQLEAVTAVPTVRQLQAAILRRARFADIERDYTLEMQVKYFLRDAESWEDTGQHK